MARLVVTSFALVLLACALSCGDPVHDNAVSALGPELPGTSPGPTHRAGQPCLVCHDGSGPADLKLSIGGTVYAVKDATDPLPNATVHLVDANGSGRDATTNDVGNFLVAFSEWAPAAPIHVSITYQDTTATMTTHIGRDGSCASCHADPAGPSSPGRVYVALDPNDLTGGGDQ